MPLVWIYRGPLAVSRGEFRNLSDEDAERAEAEEWGQIVTGNLNPHDMRPAEPGAEHAAAQAWAEEKGLVSRPQTYPTRELRARDPAQRSVEQPDAQAETSAGPEPEAASAPAPLEAGPEPAPDTPPEQAPHPRSSRKRSR
jgi:hypothetical protein